MKKLGVILLVVLVCCGFIPQHKTTHPTTSKKSVSELYTEAVKAFAVHQDTLSVVTTIEKIFKQDSNYAPALYLLARITKSPQMAAEYAERAYLLDTTNHHYLAEHARTSVWANHLSKAEAAFKKIVRTSNEPHDFRLLAVILDHTQKQEEAVAVLDSAIVRFGRISLFCSMRQNFLLRMGRAQEAEAEAKKMVEEEPYVAANHIALAELYAITRRDSLALESFKNAIAVDSLAIDPLISLAEYYGKKKDKASYLSVLTKVFAHEELSIEVKLGEWDRLINDRQSYRAHIGLYDMLIKQLRILYPNNREVMSRYTTHLLVSGHTKEALRMCKLVLKNPSATVEDFDLVRVLEYHYGSPDSIVHHINEALKRFPNNTDFLMQKGYLAQERKDYEQALEEFNKALLSTEDKIVRGQICSTIGVMEFERDNMKRCYKAYDEALKNYGKNDSLRSNVYATLGDIEHQRGNMKECYKAYNKALKCFANNSHVLNNYAYYLSLEGRNLERALVMATLANELEPNNPTYLDTKAWVLYKLGRLADAKKVMQQALSLDRSNSPEHSLHYGDILHALGEEFMAKVYWRKALEMGADKEEIEKRFLPEEPKEKR